jgi:prepilin-type N-terminal cleavage/methylation domain-containing protein
MPRHHRLVTTGIVAFRSAKARPNVQEENLSRSERRQWARGARGFTLVELLVVITIIALISAATLPVVLPALSSQQVREAARILQAALVGARDAAIRDNAPRGIRLLVDPTFTGQGAVNNQPYALAYNRFIPIEVPGEYTTGLATISMPVGVNFTAYLEAGPGGAGPNPNIHPTPLRVDEELTMGNVPGGLPNERTSWFWNIRIGDKIRLSSGGRYYTVIGPAVINPQNPNTLGQNPELYVNDGPPGNPTQSPNAQTVGNFQLTPEYLYLVNGQDDNKDGYVDNGWDGYDNNFNGLVDDYFEWINPQTGLPIEQEQWVGTELTQLLLNVPNAAGVRHVPDLHYSILRRPTPVAGAREITLPGGIVIDATTWNSPYGQERSRLPIDPRTLYVDILVNQNGQVVPTTAYSSPTAFSSLPFYHFWLTDREDVHEMSDLWGVNTANAWGGNSNPNGGSSFLLPLPSSFYANLATQPASGAALKAERALVTLFTRTGQITSNSLENFNITDINAPFYQAQTGAREAK